jgi:hypothetical protein
VPADCQGLVVIPLAGEARYQAGRFDGRRAWVSAAALRSMEGPGWWRSMLAAMRC